MEETGLLPELHVHLGTWTNWSQGRILGATLTMSQQSGNFLIAFVALFVAFSGTCAYRIACFIMHRIFSNPNAQDGIYHQRQAILRNSANGVTAIWELSQLVWFWRHHGHRSIRRILPVLVCIFASVLAFAIAGVFSSNITALSGDEVLLKSSPFCGRTVWTDNITFADQYNAIQPDIVQHLLSYYNYAQDCYSSTAYKANCNAYVKSRLTQSIITRNASCPFAHNICHKQNGSIIFDTGLLDTNADLGMNGPRSKRLQIRRITHCSPLVTTGYTTQANVSGTLHTVYNYGGKMFQGEVMTNYTYRRALADETIESSSKDYDLNPFVARRVNGTLKSMSSFVPIEALSRPDADVFIYFLSANAIQYSNKVDDPWYAAHRQTRDSLRSGFDPETEVKAYLPDNAASPLACTEQFQLCMLGLPDGKQCTALLPSNSLAELGRDKLPAASQDDIDFAQRGFVVGTYYTDPMLFTKALGTSALMAKYSLSGGIQAPMKDNQWELDMERWHNYTLAAMQGGAADVAAGLNELVRPFYHIYKWPAEEYFCRNQKIRSTAFANFSILGLTIIFTIGGFIIIFNYIIEFSLLSCMLCMSRHHPGELYKTLEWNTNGVLQLQRLAHEGVGCGTWRYCDDETPVTESKERLAVLDVRDPKHPKLTRASTAPTSMTTAPEIGAKWSPHFKFLGTWKATTFNSSSSSKSKGSKEDLPH